MCESKTVCVCTCVCARVRVHSLAFFDLFRYVCVRKTDSVDGANTHTCLIHIHMHASNLHQQFDTDSVTVPHIPCVETNP